MSRQPSSACQHRQGQLSRRQCLLFRQCTAASRQTVALPPSKLPMLVLPPILFRAIAPPRPVVTPGKLCRRADIKMRTRLRSFLKGVFEFQLFRDLWRGGRVDKIFPRLYLLLRWCFSKSPYAIEGCTVHAVRQRQTAARSLRVGAIACVMKSYSGVSYPCKPK